MSNKYSTPRKLIKACVSALVTLMAVEVTSAQPVRALAIESPAAITPGVAYPDSLGGVPLGRPGGAQPAGAAAIRVGMSLPYLTHTPISIEAAPDVDTLTTSGIVGGVFGSVAIPMKNFPVSTRWQPIYRQINACREGAACLSPRLEAIVRNVDRKSFHQKLSLVNAKVNALVKYRRDSANYGAFDHWAAPDETLSLKSGDCEDYAILKMAGLARAGIPMQSMSLVILHDTSRDVFHAVLSVSTSNGNYILDNLSDDVRKDTILKNYVPLYSLSTNRAWIHGSRSAGDEISQVTGHFKTVAPGEGPELAGRSASPIAGSGTGFKLRLTVE